LRRENKDSFIYTTVFVGVLKVGLRI